MDHPLVINNDAQFPKMQKRCFFYMIVCTVPIMSHCKKHRSLCHDEFQVGPSGKSEMSSPNHLIVSGHFACI